jgi:Xaa-Pro aminopeptidase
MLGVETKEKLEAVGSSYSFAQLLDVRARTRAALNEIASKIKPGIAEEDARQMASDTLGDHGLKKGWHKILVRFGPNTTKNFEDPSVPHVVLGESDLFFVDIGPIYETCEGDAGGTFVFGNDADMLRAASEVKALWWKVRNKWAETKMTGAALYEFAAETAKSMGWVLNLELTGHRLSDFPHDAHYNGTMAAVEFKPSSGLWVLEIQIKHPTREFGAFFEDLLIEDEELQKSVIP